jgi:hypothetical protein
MIEFNHKGIWVDAAVKVERRDYQDANYRQKTRFERNLTVRVHFWEFTIDQLQDLAFAKSILQYFMQAYWKRANKAGGKIDLQKWISRDGHPATRPVLWFTPRQKGGKNYLHILHAKGITPVNEAYLDGQEALMLDIVLGKCINLLSPRIVEGDESRQRGFNSHRFNDY